MDELGRKVLQMTIELLKELLNDGKITKEQFDVMAKALDPNYNPESDREGAEQTKDGGGDNNTPDIEKLIQTAVDRATNKLGNDNKKLFRFRRKICCTQNREYRACERSNSAGNKA